MKIVLDSNIIIASFVSRGLCRDVFELCLSEHELITSGPILEEIRGWLKRKLGLPEFLAEEIRGILTAEARIVKASKVPANSCRDPQDNMVLGTAFAGKADAIITGDKDLLVLEQFRSIRILSPRDFWNYVRQKPRKE